MKGKMKSGGDDGAWAQYAVAPVTGVDPDATADGAPTDPYPTASRATTDRAATTRYRCTR